MLPSGPFDGAIPLNADKHTLASVYLVATVRPVLLRSRLLALPRQEAAAQYGHPAMAEQLEHRPIGMCRMQPFTEEVRNLSDS